MVKLIASILIYHSSLLAKTNKPSEYVNVMKPFCGKTNYFQVSLCDTRMNQNAISNHLCFCVDNH